MSIQFYKTIKSVLSLYLVPDVINIILEMVNEMIIKDGLEKYKKNLVKLNNEYHKTWTLDYKPILGFFLVTKVKRDKYNSKISINDREFDYIDHDNGAEIISFKTGFCTGKLPINY